MVVTGYNTANVTPKGGATMLGGGHIPPPFETKGVRGDKKI